MSFINKTNCRKFLLDKALERWPNGKFTRVSGDVFEWLDACLRTDMVFFVENHPTVGKTLMVGKKEKSPNETV